MTRIIINCLVLLVLWSTTTSAQNLRAEFAMAKFSSPDDGPYLETYLKLIGNSLKVIETENGSYSEVLITYRITNGFWTPFKDVYKVKGPINPKGELLLDFIDQQRINLKQGTFDLTITIKDLNDSLGVAATVNQKVVIETKGKIVAEQGSIDSVLENSKANISKPHIFKSNNMFSDIQFVDNYYKTNEPNILTKNGFDLVPYTSNYYPQPLKELNFYVEIYNTDEFFTSVYYLDLLHSDNDKSEETNEKRGDEFLVNMFVENADDGKIISGLRKFVKRKYAKVVPILQTFPIEQLPSGNYNLVVEIRDRKNTLIDSRIIFFQRSNKLTAEDKTALVATGEKNELYSTFVTKYQNLDDLKEYLRCLHPISSQDEITQVNTKMNFRDRNAMWKFMYEFWVKRNPENPEEAWLKYWKEVQKVNETYSNNLSKGYDTDQGRVYLQYGAPNTIVPNHFEPNTYPYEVWHYYQLESPFGAPQSNRKFIFANIDIGAKNFDLIHSDAKNEITNSRWHHDLHKRSSTSHSFDDEQGPGHFGGRSQDAFENPY